MEVQVWRTYYQRICPIKASSGSIYVGWMQKCVNRKSWSEDGTGNFASVLRDQEGKEVQKTEVAFVGIGRNIVSIVVAIRGTL